MNTGIHPVLWGIISAATLESLEDLYKFNAKFWHLKRSMYVFYIIQSMAISWYKKCDGQKPEKNKYVKSLVDSGHYILFVDTHMSAQETAKSVMCSQHCKV